MVNNFLLFVSQILLLISFNSLVLSSQPLASDKRFGHIDVTSGLANNMVTGITQDDAGFLWFSTFDGLCRYDGYTIKTFRQSDKKNSISDNFILDIYTCSNNYLWIGTNSGGLSQFNSTTHLFKNYLPNDTDSTSIASARVTSIAEDNEGYLWLASYFGGLTRLNPVTNETKIYSHIAENKGSISSNLTTEVIVDNAGIIWIGTQDAGLNRFDPQTETFKHYFADEQDSSSLATNEIYSLFVNSDGVLMVGTNRGLSIYNEESDDFINQFDFGINDIKETLDGYYFGTYFGLIFQSKDKTVTKKYVHNDHIPSSLSVNDVTCLFFDDAGILWLGTAGGGVNNYYASSKKFITYKHDPTLPNTLSTNNIRGFAEDMDGNIWIATMNGGINVFEPGPQFFHSIAMGHFNDVHLPVFSTYAAFCDSNGSMWIGTWGEGLYVLPYGEKKFFNLRKQEGTMPSLLHNTVQAIFEDSFGNMWIGTEDGLSVYNKESKRFRNFIYHEDSINSITQYAVQSNCIVEDIFGNYWVGTYGGLNHFIRHNTHENSFFDDYTVNRYVEDTLHGNGLSDQRVIAMHYNEELFANKLFVGTYGGGLLEITISYSGDKIESIKEITTDEGLPNNVVFAIESDHLGYLWMSTNKGLAKYNPETNQITNYDHHDGLQGDQFFWGAGFKSKSGELYFGGISGFNRFFPDDIKLDEYVPPIVLTDFKVFNESVEVGEQINDMVILPEAIHTLDEIVLSYKENILTFEFSALHFAFPEDHMYEYMLEGFEKSYNKVSSDFRMATYTNLDPGEYTFKIKAANHDGFWSPSEKKVKLVITPPYWKTFWFRFLAIAFGLTLVTTVYLMRVRSIERQSKLLKKMVAEKTGELEDKNQQLIKQTKDLNNYNLLLEERQRQIQEQSEELLQQAESLALANQELLENNATKDKFFSIIAHDLKNPINTLMGFSELLHLKYDEIEEGKKKSFIKLMLDSSDHLNTLIDNLLTWSRSQAKRIQYNFEDFSLSGLINENIYLYRDNLIKKKIKLNFPKQSDKVIVRVDVNSMNTVIRNLLANAIKFTPANGSITIDYKVDGKKDVVVSVIDTGVGMSPAMIENVFSVGKSTSSAGTEGEKGTGLGLILCSEFVEANKGRIWIESEEGHGTTVKFTCLLAKQS
jgi:signal transduction histidine kinase/ligand-binding sensor domain-containing protein